MDYYKILQVTRESTDDDIKRAYKKLVLKYHPDKNKDDGAEEMFKKITSAYEVLSDSKRRRVYDLTGNTEDGVDLQTAFKTFVENFDNDNMKELFADCLNVENIPHLFEGIKNTGISFSLHTFSGIPAFNNLPIFNRSGYPFNGISKNFNKSCGNPFLREDEEYEIVDDSSEEPFEEEADIPVSVPVKSGKGKDLNYDLYVSLEDAYKRKRKRVSVSRYRKSDKSNEYKKEKIKLHVPLYKYNVVFEGEGDQTEDFEKAGDVVINIHYKNSNKWKVRNEYNISYDQEISLSELYTGGKYIIDLPNKKKIEVEVDKKLLSMNEGEREIKVSRKGLPKSDKERGDLYVRFIVKLPQLEDKEIKEVEKLFPKFS